jgi:shikimate 5-dehydrogenase
MIENYSWLASAECDLLINATPAGAFSGDDWKKIFLKKTPADMIVMDINYRQNADPFLNSEAFEKNRRFDGRDMLLEQALIQFLIWTGIDVESESRRSLQKKVEKSE